jgi:hypothetical protein
MTKEMTETKHGERVPIPEEDRAKLFLWCARHCCFCGKACTTNIIIHHIDGNPANNDLDNLIPVCFDCHGELERYNPQHPVGTKYRHLEIKARREQIFEQYTLPYLRQIEINISRLIYGSRQQRKLGDTSCTVRTLSQDIAVKLRLEIIPYHNGQRMEADLGALYSGRALWNLNPTQLVAGHFFVPISEDAVPFHFRIEAHWSIVDVLEREHRMLPFSYVLSDPEKDWYFDPRVLFAAT